MSKYHIEVSITPDNKHLNKPYFWCILKLIGTEWVNDGFGWSITPQNAWEDANKYYQNNH